MMIQITPSFAIPDSEIEEKFIQASGPGGQNVNKVASAVQLRFNIVESQSLPEPVKQRLRLLADKQITSDGILIIEARQHRTQERNRRAAQTKLCQLIQQAMNPPKQRKPTKPSRAAKERRLQSKRHRSQKKAWRQRPPEQG